MLHLHARRVQEELISARSELEAAISKINTHDIDQILSGLQTIAVLNDRDLQRQALSRVSALAEYEDSQISSQAKATIEKMSAPLAKSAGAGR
jgi:hypothetical protein